MDQHIIDKVIAFRREVHRFPQVSMHEFQTQKRVRNILLEFGVSQDSIKYLKPTALVVDLKGKAQPKGQNFCVAFRADMDALSMVEQNGHLQYRSQNNGAAHMCGHDGHMACLIGFVPIFLKQIQNIPSNKTVRLLFQPSEQGPESGAKLMIEQGCLQGVDEVYGFHNWPIGKFGDIWCKEGPVMSKVTMIKIKIIGTGGHGSQPQALKVAIQKAADFYQQITHFVQQLKQKSGKFFVCTFPVFQAGQRYNVISQQARIEGTLRTFDDDICNQVMNKLKSLLQEIRLEGFKCELELGGMQMNCNTKKQAENVLRVAKQFLGEDRVGSGSLPFKASQDFSYFTRQRPGAYFFFCTKKQQDEVFLHNSKFNFKDQLIELASTFWLKLALDRLNSK